MNKVNNKLKYILISLGVILISIFIITPLSILLINKDNEVVNKEIYKISVDYDIKNLKASINYNGLLKYKDELDLNKINRLIPGDKIELGFNKNNKLVSYQEELVSYSSIKLEKLQIPGTDDQFFLRVNDDEDNKSITYVEGDGDSIFINNDYSITLLKDISFYDTSIYALYLEDNLTKHDKNGNITYSLKPELLTTFIPRDMNNL